MLAKYQSDFIDFVLEADVLRFGEFTLKSGRVSPYFFNAGAFNTGSLLSRLGGFYAQALVESGTGFDVLFGPAYKGIPLVCSAAIAMGDLLARTSHMPLIARRRRTMGRVGSSLVRPSKAERLSLTM